MSVSMWLFVVTRIIIDRRRVIQVAPEGFVLCDRQSHVPAFRRRRRKTARPPLGASAGQRKRNVLASFAACCRARPDGRACRFRRRDTRRTQG